MIIIAEEVRIKCLRILRGALSALAVAGAVLGVAACSDARAATTPPEWRTAIGELLDRKGGAKPVDDDTGDLAASRMLFILLDTDADGRLSKSELQAGIKRFLPEKSETKEARARRVEELRRALAPHLDPAEAEKRILAAERAAARESDIDADFVKLGAGAVTLEFEQFDRARHPKTETESVRRMIAAAREGFMRNYLSTRPDSSFYPVARGQFEGALIRWAAAEKEAADADKPRALPSYQAGTGLVIAGDTAAMKKNPFTDAVVLRVAASGDGLLSGALVPHVTRGEEIEKAQIGFSRSRGEDDKLTLDGAVRLDIRRAAWLSDANRMWLPFLAAEVQRRGDGDDKVDLRRYYARVLYFQRHGTVDSFLEGSSFVFGPMYETNLKDDINTVVLGADWEPVINFGPLHTGRWVRVGAVPGMRFAVTPKLGIEHRNVVDKPAASTADDSLYATMTLKTGVSFFDGGFVLGFKYKHSESLRSGKPDAIQREWTASIPLTKDDAVSLTGSRKSGEVAPGAAFTSNYEVGLGIKW